MAKVKFRYEKRWLNFKSKGSLLDYEYRVVSDKRLFEILEEIKEIVEKDFTFDYYIKPSRWAGDSGVLTIKAKRKSLKSPRVTKMQLVNGVVTKLGGLLDLKW